MAVPLLPGPAAMPLASIVTHDVTIVTTRKLAQARVMGVPPEEFGIERGARSIRDCNYCFHEVVTKTEAQLIAEGFDAAQIKSLN
ncbi:portal protein, partial [Glaesserella parasuis]